LFGQGKVEVMRRVLVLKVDTIEAATAKLVLTVTEAIQVTTTTTVGDRNLKTVSQRGTHLGRARAEGVEGV
jgi:Tfp pilus assembly PilM family ATPase